MLINQTNKGKTFIPDFGSPRFKNWAVKTIEQAK